MNEGTVEVLLRYHLNKTKRSVYWLHCTPLIHQKCTLANKTVQIVVMLNSTKVN